MGVGTAALRGRSGAVIDIAAAASENNCQCGNFSWPRPFPDESLGDFTPRIRNRRHYHDFRSPLTRASVDQVYGGEATLYAARGVHKALLSCVLAPQGKGLFPA
jgi:hypothetical protein